MTIGEMLGPYRVLAKLGEGGMGAVYRARDTRLGRDVAIKVLSPAFAADPDRLNRFEQEARAASALDHPNILAVHDVGSAPIARRTEGEEPGGPAELVHYLVTELLDGETLRERLKTGPLPARKAIEMAVQTAEGLAAAHGKGIVHRDLKPENLFITPDGRIKILDFGLAKLRPAPDESTVLPARQTTEPGVVLGTVAYMSPEQVRGLPVDHRSDLFSLGAVLHEMVSGRPAFGRATAADTMSAILKEEPSALSSTAGGVPPALERVVLHCLEKQPEERFQSARDLAFDLQALSAASGPQPASGQAARTGRRVRLAWSVAVVATAVAIGAVVAPRWLGEVPAGELTRFAVTAPEGETLVPDVTATAIAPDGRHLVLSTVDAAGTMRLWVRALDSLTAAALAGTEGGTFPFWSPDSRFVAFFANGKLRKVPAAGGPAQIICDAPDGRGGSWSKEGVIVFAPLAAGPLFRVSADGGEAVEAAKPDRARGEAGLRFPCFLPDGTHFLYASFPRKPRGFDIYIGSLDSKEPRRVVSALSAPVYTEPGYLLFALGDRLVAQRLDRTTLQPLGDAVTLGDAPPRSVFDAGTALSASVNGVLAHFASSPPVRDLVWLDRTGREAGRIPLPPGRYFNPSLSPNGRWAAVTKFNSSASYDLWLVDLQRSVTTRLTFDGLVEGTIGPALPVCWSPDSTRIAYYRSGVYDIYQILANGAGQPEPLVRSDAVYDIPAAYSPDGKYFVFSQLGEDSQYDIWLLPLQGDRTPVRYLRTPFNENSASVSPDGRWLAYDSDETGTSEIYVRSFPEPGEKTRVSTSGALLTQWSRDGRTLLYSSLSYFHSGTGPIYAVDVETTPTFKAGVPRVLFTTRPDLSGLSANGDLSRFLTTAPAEGSAPPSITITLNWEQALKGGRR